MAQGVYLFAGGGTGGHLFPGIAVAEQLLTQQPDSRILFVGSDRPIERQILAGTPFAHCELPSPSLTQIRQHPLQFACQLNTARRRALELIQREQPAAIVGCGGFASVAPVYAAWRRGVPFVLLEQNTIPGRATRWLSRLGGTVCLSFAAARSHLPQSTRAVITGNPLRREIAELATRPYESTPPPGGARTLLVLGGSQGARPVNELLIGFTNRSPHLLGGWRVVHQTGPADVELVRQAYAAVGIDADVADFFPELVGKYREASLVVSRAGATTLAELACARAPAILVPYPQAMDNHQWHNAREFAHAGAAVVVEQHSDPNAGSRGFDDTLSRLLNDEQRRVKMARSMAGLALPDAATRVVELLLADG